MKYTTEDFENARFAIHQDGNAIALRWTKDYTSEPDECWVYERPLNNRFSKEATHQEMADMGGWVPVPTKPTMTDSEYMNLVARKPAGYEDGYYRGFLDAGGEFIADPEPTNVKKLEKLFDQYDRERSMDPLSVFLDKHGVKVED